jgi:hypothetical protein
LPFILPLLEDVAFYNVQQIKKLKEREKKPSLKRQKQKLKRSRGRMTERVILVYYSRK